MGESSLVDSLAVVHRRLTRSLDRLLAEEGATVDQWRILRTVAASDGLLMGELAERVGIPGPSVTRIVDGLVDRALVYRTRTDPDRRRVAVRVSDAGLALLRRMDAVAAAHEQGVRDVIGEAAFQGLVRAADRLGRLEASR